jgi:archaemetzincin
MGPSSEDRPPLLLALDFLTIGPFPRALSEELVAAVSRRVSVPCRLLETSLETDLPLLPGRGQVDADFLLERLETKQAARKTAPGTVLVGLTTQDVGTSVFTFAFGRARHNGHAALVSLARLRPEFYGLTPGPRLTVRRAVAEILHEVGHAAGAGHCNDLSCLMHFATNVESVDLRGAVFCSSCAAQLPAGLSTSRP